MTEVAVNVPFDANEIKAIVCEELRKRLDTLGPLQGAKEYASFQVFFNVNIQLRRTGEVTTPKETLAWGDVQRGEAKPTDETETVAGNYPFQSGDPNKEREDRGMPLTVESKDGRGNITRRKVKVK